MIGEDRRVERQPDEDGDEQAGRPVEEPAVRDAQIESGEGGGEERPAQGDPLAVELEGDGRGDESRMVDLSQRMDWNISVACRATSDPRLPWRSAALSAHCVCNHPNGSGCIAVCLGTSCAGGAIDHRDRSACG